MKAFGPASSTCNCDHPACAACRAKRRTRRIVFARLASKRLRLEMHMRDLNAEVLEASGGRLHTQGCRLGGLATGMGASCNGDDCWCGQHYLGEDR